jgi:hypothetical protein
MENTTNLLTEIRDLLKDVREELRNGTIATAAAQAAAPIVVESTDDNFTTCVGTTAKGKPCTNKRIDNSEYCGMHGGNKKRKAPTSGTSTTKAKIIPTHDHGEAEVSPTCDLCVQHGDVLDPSVVNAEYAIQERLKSILS